MARILPSERALNSYVEHLHGESNYQGKDNVMLFSAREPDAGNGSIRSGERLRGHLKFYHREAA